jgi:hypothetical protein
MLDRYIDLPVRHAIDLRTSATGHPLILLSPSTGTRASNPTIVCRDPDPDPVDEARVHLGCPQPDGPPPAARPPRTAGTRFRSSGHGDVLADRSRFGQHKGRLGIGHGGRRGLIGHGTRPVWQPAPGEPGCRVVAHQRRLATGPDGRGVPPTASGLHTCAAGGSGASAEALSPVLQRGHPRIDARVLVEVSRVRLPGDDERAPVDDAEQVDAETDTDHR